MNASAPLGAMHAAGGLSPRDWGSVLHGGSVVVSSTGINSVINTRHAAGGSMVSSSSCSSYPSLSVDLDFPEPSTLNLWLFCRGLRGCFGKQINHNCKSCCPRVPYNQPRTGALQFLNPRPKPFPPQTPNSRGLGRYKLRSYWTAPAI